MRRRTVVPAAAAWAAGAWAAAAWAGTARAQGGPVRIVFPFAAGGGGDSLCRLLAEDLRTALGRPVLVENRVGADGRIGINGVRTAAPDGTTFLVTTGPTMWLMPIVHPAPGYDPVADFEPVSLLARFEFCVGASRASGLAGISDFAAWVKARPAESAYAIPGAGTIPHFIGIRLSQLVGAEMRRVPYRGGAPAINDLVGGQIALSVGTLADAYAQHRAGTIRLLATTGAERSPFTPELPTLKEAGYDVVGDAWYGLWAPRGTPSGLVGEMNRAVRAALERPATRARLTELGLTAAGTAPEALLEAMRAEVARWKPVIEASGYRMEN